MTPLGNRPRAASASPDPAGPAGAPPAAAGRRRPLRLVAYGAVGLAAGVGLVLLLLPHWLTTPSQPGSPNAVTPSSDARRIRATLYYVSQDGNGLVAVDREVPFASGPADQARRIVEAQVGAAPDGLVSPIPAGTTVRGLYITAGGEAYVDLSPEIASGHGGGSLDEALTVYAIVNALTVNLPDITAAQILIDGKEADTLAGHLDLRRPLKRSLVWVRKDSGPS